MDQREAFSVSMCVYHGDDPEHFSLAVDSVLHQTAVPDEVVLVVDGPVPGALDAVISEYERLDSFNVIRLPENQGHGVARRTGLEHCTHSLVALMDSDDISLPDRFEKQLAAFAAEPGVSIVGGQIAEFVDSVENVVGYRTVPLTEPEIKAYMKVRCPMNQVTVMFRKADVQAAGGYLDWYCNEDYYLWVRMHLAGMRFANVPEVLVNVRVGADMYRRRGGWKYFASEAKLQKYMLKNHVMGFGAYVINVAKRMIVQLMPNRIRGWVFRTFARSRKNQDEKP